MVKLGLDPGHGGRDGGAGTYSLLEKTLALNISLEIKTQLERDYEGIQVFMTRSTDLFLELDERTDLMNKLDVDALISVHCNAGGGKGGFETFRYNKASTNSVKLQNAIHTAVMNELKPFGVIDRGQKTENLHMVRESKMPAVLTENLFIDVLADSERLKRPEVIQAIIDGHVKGIASYFGIKRKETAKVTTERDIHKVSDWAESAWEEMTKNGYYDGSRPGATQTREEAAVVMYRFRKNFLKLISIISEDIAELDRRLVEIEVAD
ncbi:N-acetylmuramoyl-L-alanine amidase [Paenibacillus provencensis]|uniref:N-acetylmuramoyl-L-alanine amidase n=1 Tax=Paenibacillus provencensis TaxID=441151 RepID=A0ABW3PYK8_9BACL|nr:N-acetylmuramoyl-L-alanine amidase [Paenibacillus sp. MER 78]MCM3130365.1 N-acetylmuramoyl-L-alanine amidase [Paenibacillus sp. MER 78]